LAARFSRLGLTAFGGPAAHIAMMEDEVVARREWLTREAFLDLIGATNLIPGPNSTEMAIHVGYMRAGWPGLAVAGVCFILPAVLVTGCLAWAYVRFGALPEVAPLLFGIKPAVLAVIFAAVWRLGKSAVKSWRLAVIGAAVAALCLAGGNEVLALLCGGLGGALWLRAHDRRTRAQGLDGRAGVAGAAAKGTVAAGAGATAAAALAQSGAVPLWKLGLFFLKIGVVLYGSGYVLVAFLQGGLVQGYGWLSQQQLLDAISIGQFTPGPVLSTSTFIGYLIAGWPGAVVATLGIFLPSFGFVAALNPFVPRLRQSPITAAFLDAVNASAMALMAAVTVELARDVLVSWPAWAIAVVAVVLGTCWKVNAAWLVLGGAIVGRLLGRWAGLRVRGPSMARTCTAAPRRA